MDDFQQESLHEAILFFYFSRITIFLKPGTGERSPVMSPDGFIVFPGFWKDGLDISPYQAQLHRGMNSNRVEVRAGETGL
jgi:hypothetical protein